MKSSALHVANGFEGVIQGAALPDLIQMECLSMTTRAVRVERGSFMGRIFFAGGQIVHAELGSSIGEKALFEMLYWKGGTFSIEEGVRPLDETITCDWHTLLLEAAHHHDEASAAFANQAPPQISALPMTATPFQNASDDPEVIKAVRFSDDGTLLD